MENKSFYYITNWDDAAEYTRMLEALDIPHSVESPNENVVIHEGQLAIVFPEIFSYQYNDVRQLFGGEGISYHTES